MLVFQLHIMININLYSLSLTDTHFKLKSDVTLNDKHIETQSDNGKNFNEHNFVMNFNYLLMQMICNYFSKHAESKKVF